MNQQMLLRIGLISLFVLAGRMANADVSQSPNVVFIFADDSGYGDLGFDYYFGVPVVNSAPPYIYVENDRVLGGDPADPLVYLGRGTHKEATPISEIPPEASRRAPNRFKGALKAHKLYNDYTVGTVLAEKAVDWITDNKQKPFFLYLATTHIHHPFTPGK